MKEAKAFFIAFIFVIIILKLPKTSCDNDTKFRPHIVMQHRNNKLFYVKHLTSCSGCISIDNDINGDTLNCNTADYVIYQDNGEVVFGKQFKY